MHVLATHEQSASTNACVHAHGSVCACVGACAWVHEYVYGNATEISYGDDTSLVSFKDYDSLYGILGDFKLSGFGSSYDIVMANFDDSFESWYGGDELNLAIA